jgi:hypothetical protein
MERWLEIPQLAAGPEVTPTKPIFNTGLAANAAPLKDAAMVADSRLTARKLRFFMDKTPWEGMEEERNFPNLAVFAFHQVGGRIFYRVNNLVNIL